MSTEYFTDTQPQLTYGAEELASGGQNWTLPITIKEVRLL